MASFLFVFLLVVDSSVVDSQPFTLILFGFALGMKYKKCQRWGLLSYNFFFYILHFLQIALFCSGGKKEMKMECVGHFVLWRLWVGRGIDCFFFLKYERAFPHPQVL